MVQPLLVHSIGGNASSSGIAGVLQEAQGQSEFMMKCNMSIAPAQPASEIEDTQNSLLCALTDQSL